jgi:hypothetical protein
VLPAATIVTGPGELRRYQVRHVVHVATVQGEPGAGFHQMRDVSRCGSEQVVATAADPGPSGPAAEGMPSASDEENPQIVDS